jgi:hypothetical protein
LDIRDVRFTLFEALGLIVHLVIEQAGFDSGIAGQTPVAGRELMDEIRFGFSLRAKVIEIVVERGLVFQLGFVLEDDGTGGESVLDGVEGDGLFSFFGFGAGGFCAVGTGGCDFAWG